MKSKTLEDEIQDALKERANIDKLIDIRNKKDKEIITKFYIQNPEPDLFSIINLIDKFASRKTDKEFINNFKEDYKADKLNLFSIAEYNNLYDLYREKLKESRGKANV